MFKSLSRAFALCLAAFAPARTAAQSNLDGYWEYKVPNGGVSFFLMKQNGETLTATDQDWRMPSTGSIRATSST